MTWWTITVNLFCTECKCDVWKENGQVMCEHYAIDLWALDMALCDYPETWVEKDEV